MLGMGMVVEGGPLPISGGVAPVVHFLFGEEDDYIIVILYNYIL